MILCIAIRRRGRGSKRASCRAMRASMSSCAGNRSPGEPLRTDDACRRAIVVAGGGILSCRATPHGDVCSRTAHVPLDWKPLSGMPARKLLPLLRQGVAAAPDRSVIKVRLARALLEAGETSEAIDLLKPVLTDPNAAPDLLFFLGQAAAAEGDDPLALTALRSAVTKGADGAVAFLASTLRRLGREDEAIEIALEALNRRPENTAPLRPL